jgi:hypothetical protein
MGTNESSMGARVLIEDADVRVEEEPEVIASSE